ncbi:MAG: hypothetical protein HOW73_33990 [Polyangiaceae bacterium]|nr:hypothetical protein [Polyangiaceae bacterium]
MRMVCTNCGADAVYRLSGQLRQVRCRECMAVSTPPELAALPELPAPAPPRLPAPAPPELPAEPPELPAPAPPGRLVVSILEPKPQAALATYRTVALASDRPVVRIDLPTDLRYAPFLAFSSIWTLIALASPVHGIWLVGAFMASAALWGLIGPRRVVVSDDVEAWDRPLRGRPVKLPLSEIRDVRLKPVNDRFRMRAYEIVADTTQGPEVVLLTDVRDQDAAEYIQRVIQQRLQA